MTEHVDGITIPRANAKVSGGNFEVLVGFDVTPEMADFNRDGKRFRANAGQTSRRGRAAPRPMSDLRRGLGEAVGRRLRRGRACRRASGG